MSTPAPATTPVLTVDGAELAAKWLDHLIDVRVERGFGIPGQVTLRFADGEFELSTESIFSLGSSVEIKLSDGGGHLIKTTVTGVAIEQRVSAAPEVVVTAHDAGYKLTRSSHVRTFLNLSYADVIRQVASEAGLVSDVSALASEVPEYLLQAGGDMEFIDGLARRIGYVWWLADDKLVAKPPDTSDPAVELDGLREFSVRASGLRPADVTVTGWDPAMADNLVGTAKASTRKGSVPAFVDPYQHPERLGSAVMAAGDRNPATPNEATRFANSLYDDWASSAVEARGTCLVTAAVAPGVTVAVREVGPASGKYLVSGVEHRFTRAGFFTRFVAGPNRPAGLVDTLGPSVGDGGLTLGGAVVGLVTDNNDLDKVGRVKVKYVGIDGVAESPWARVVTLGAGGDRGVVFMPEVGDEVLVVFERGDARRPIVIGGLYSKKHTMSEWGVKDSAVASRRITSRTGHILEFSDGDPDAESYVLLQLGTAAHKLRLGKDRFDIELAQGKPVLIKSGTAKFEITAQGDIAIEGNNVSIKANQQLQLEGTAQASMKANGEASVQAAQVAVKANGTANVESAGMLSLKGGMVAIN